MAVSADELNGYRRDRYFARSWALLTLEKGWWKPVLIMALFGLIPVVGILALVGYALETARVTAWGINAGPKQKDLKFGTYIVTGFKAVVIALAFGLAYSIATGILTFIPVINLILIPVFIVAAFVYPLFINVVQVRASVYGHISAGFAFKNIFEMIKHDMGGLFRIFGMGIVLGIVTSIIMGIIGGSAAISMIVNIGAQAMAIARTQNISSQQQLGLVMLALLARGFIQMGPIFLVIGYIGHVVGLIVMLLMQNAIALWMRQFNVPAWGQSNDPLPPFINDPRDGAAAVYSAPAPVAPTAPAATAAPAAAPVAVPVAAPAPVATPAPAAPAAPAAPVAPAAPAAPVAPVAPAAPVAPEVPVAPAAPEPAPASTVVVEPIIPTTPEASEAPAAPTDAPTQNPEGPAAQ
ncbi:MAG: DUF4013 domain-containing protein [Atopobium sp.]|nr:DUF4013 domain-containing protein [Atopobium sp.]